MGCRGYGLKGKILIGISGRLIGSPVFPVIWALGFSFQIIVLRNRVSAGGGGGIGPFRSNPRTRPAQRLF